MTATLLSFSRRSPGWDAEELGLLMRVERLLAGAGLQVEMEHGLTEEGDPWCVFCTPANGDVLIHVARIDGLYVLDSTALGRPIEGRGLMACAERFLSEAPALVPPGANRGATLCLHPSALLASVFMTLVLFVQMHREVGQAEWGRVAATADGDGDGDGDGRDAAVPEALGPRLKQAAAQIQTLLAAETRHNERHGDQTGPLSHWVALHAAAMIATLSLGHEEGLLRSVFEGAYDAVLGLAMPQAVAEADGPAAPEGAEAAALALAAAPAAVLEAAAQAVEAVKAGMSKAAAAGGSAASVEALAAPVVPAAAQAISLDPWEHMAAFGDPEDDVLLFAPAAQAQAQPAQDDAPTAANGAGEGAANGAGEGAAAGLTDRVIDALLSAGAREAEAMPDTVQAAIEDLFGIVLAMDEAGEATGETADGTGGSAESGIDGMLAALVGAAIDGAPVAEAPPGAPVAASDAGQRPAAPETRGPVAEEGQGEVSGGTPGDIPGTLPARDGPAVGIAAPVDEPVEPAPVERPAPTAVPEPAAETPAPGESVVDPTGDTVRQTVSGVHEGEAGDWYDMDHFATDDALLFREIRDHLAGYGRRELADGHVIYFDDNSSHRAAAADLLSLSYESDDGSLQILVTYAASPGLSDWLALL